MIKDWLIQVGLDISLAISGFVGSVIMISKGSAKNMKTTFIGIVSGTLSANYITPLVVEAIGLSEKSKFGVAFLLGYFGLKGIEIIFSKYVSKDGTN